MTLRPLAVSLCLSVLLSPLPGRAATPGLDTSLLKESRHSLGLAETYLLSQQEENGSWKNQPPITALVLYAFLLAPEAEFYGNEQAVTAAVDKGFAYLEGYVREDGGVYDKDYANYCTAVCLMAFAESRRPAFASIVKKARQFLIRFQLDEGEEIDPANPFYGGIGYGGDTRPDLSNLQLAIDAIHQADAYIKDLKLEEMPKTDEAVPAHWQKALVFLGRCQNLKRVNDMPYATDDGGFIYETGTYKPPRSHSYGSMTYAGVKSLLYTDLKNDDVRDRVEKAFAWIEKHYTWDENPGFANKSLYYYYMTASKALDAYGREVLTDGDGRQRAWRRELVDTLIALQHADGHWVNENGRFWENQPDLTTAYAMVAQKFALAGQVREAKAGVLPQPGTAQ